MVMPLSSIISKSKNNIRQCIRKGALFLYSGRFVHYHEIYRHLSFCCVHALHHKHEGAGVQYPSGFYQLRLPQIRALLHEDPSRGKGEVSRP